MYFYYYDYVFSLYVYVRLPWLRFFHAFSSVVRQMPRGKTRKDGAWPALFLVVVLLYVFFVLFYVLFVLWPPVLFVCTCVLNNCHRVATELQLNISYHISYNKSCNVPFIGLLEINVFFITVSSATIIYCHVCLTSEVMHRTNSYIRQMMDKVIKTKQNLTTYQSSFGGLGVACCF